MMIVCEVVQKGDYRGLGKSSSNSWVNYPGSNDHLQTSLASRRHPGMCSRRCREHTYLHRRPSVGIKTQPEPTASLSTSHTWFWFQVSVEWISWGKWRVYCCSLGRKRKSQHQDQKKILLGSEPMSLSLLGEMWPIIISELWNRTVFPPPAGRRIWTTSVKYLSVADTSLS